MNCVKCGNIIQQGDKFCGNCGTPVDNNVEQGSVGYTNTSYAEPYHMQDYKKPDNNTDNNNSNHTFIIILIIILVVIIGLAGCAVYLLVFRDSDSVHTDRYNTVSLSDASPTKEPSPKPTELPLPVFNKVAASSTRGTDTEGGQYSADAVLSKDLQTKWVPKKSSDGGIDEWIEISSDNIQYVSSIQILNGYHKDPNVWSNNNRVKNCTITFSNGESRSFVLDDTMDLIDLELGEVIETTSIRLTIKSLYYGAKWNDTAITYIGAY
ncbi:MAG: NADase-type glycan-binding domain-containing protein [Candidatus Ornithomonoglobus sp.]